MKTGLASSRSSLPPSTGAGIFVTTVVAGSVALVKPFTVASRPFLRDVTFYMVAVYWTFFMLYRGTTTMKETFGTDTQIHTHTQLIYSMVNIFICRNFQTFIMELSMRCLSFTFMNQ